jgi:hypothetical protein
VTAVDLDRRALGAVRFVDATTLLPVNTPLEVEADGVRWYRNRSGLYAITGAPGVPGYTTSWSAQPDDVELGSVHVTLTVRDPSGRYLPRRRTVSLPRDPDPEHVPSTGAKPADFLPEQDDTVGSLYLPIDVVLFPAPCAPVAPGWAVVHATVAGDTPESRLAGALIRVVRDVDDAHLGSALTDARGEALIAVAGIPVTTWTHGSGSVTTTTVEVTLDILHDPEAGGLPDPYDLEKRRAELHVRSRAATLASGVEISQTL